MTAMCTVVVLIALLPSISAIGRNEATQWDSTLHYMAPGEARKQTNLNDGAATHIQVSTMGGKPKEYAGSEPLRRVFDDFANDHDTIPELVRLVPKMATDAGSSQSLTFESGYENCDRYGNLTVVVLTSEHCGPLVQDLEAKIISSKDKYNLTTGRENYRAFHVIDGYTTSFDRILTLAERHNDQSIFDDRILSTFSDLLGWTWQSLRFMKYHGMIKQQDTNCLQCKDLLRGLKSMKRHGREKQQYISSATCRELVSKQEGVLTKIEKVEDKKPPSLKKSNTLLRLKNFKLILIFAQATCDATDMAISELS